MAKEKAGSANILEVEGLRLSFAGLDVLRDISFEVGGGDLFSIIGPNGAGKTSLYNCISGLYEPQTGSIKYDGDEIVGESAHDIARRGIGRTFQNIALFENLSVLENLQVGRHHLIKYPWWKGLLRTPAMVSEELAQRVEIEEIIDLLDLASFRKLPVAMLPYGVLKRVEVGRALAMQPDLLLLDEPAAGLNHEETEDMARYLTTLRERLGITMVLIEHDLRFVMDLSDTVLALNFGEMVALGSPAEVQKHEAVVEAYIGAYIGVGK